MPPQRTGIADYSAELLAPLTKRAEVDLWVDAPAGAEAAASCRMFNYIAQPELLFDLVRYDLIVYQMGNSPAHRSMFPVLLQYPGIVVMHDFVLHHFIAGYYLEAQSSPALYIQEMAYNFGRAGEEIATRALRTKTPIWEHEPMRYPLNKRVLDNARAVVVHSDFTFGLVRKTHSYLPIKKINLPTRIEPEPPDAAKLKRRYGIPVNSIVIASFGSGNPSKMTGETARAIATMDRKDIIYLVVGEMGEGLRAQTKTDLGERMRITGYVDAGTFNDYCALIDIAIDLRSQTMGESSAGICRLMAAGKPCVISNFGWFAELPDECAVKIDSPVDEKAIQRSLAQLVTDDRLRREIGTRARRYISDHHGIDQATEQYIEFLNDVRKLEISRAVQRTIVTDTGQAMAELGIASEDKSVIDGVARAIADLFGPDSQKSKR
jgi:glycosyltransferase involved in cell wall biosynthesis